MTLSIWRYAHLSLAIIASLFLVMASLSGAILAYDAVQEKVPSYKSKGFDTLSVADLLVAVDHKYEEISEITIDHNSYVSIKAMDSEGMDVEAIIDPANGNVLTKPLQKSDFMLWVTAFHRSLFLKETGRLMIGIVSFLLILISISGLMLVIQRQRSLSRFFGKIVKTYFAQYFHVVSGRIMLLPILLLAITGTYLSMARFQFFEQPTEPKINVPAAKDDNWQRQPEKFEKFKAIPLAQVQKIEFPFGDDPSEYFTLKLKDRTLYVNQFDERLFQEVVLPKTQVWETISLDWHTGRSNNVLAIILGLASINILFFVYSGFVIALRRDRTKIKNKYKATQAEYVLLVGSEMGSSLFFADTIHKQLLALGKKSFLAQLNDYEIYPEAKHLLVFTSTYGLGDAPSNASKVLGLITNSPQQQEIEYAVIGFGARAYPDFCQFAKDLDVFLGKQTWAKATVQLHTVDDKSTSDFVKWVAAWNQHSGLELSTTPATYAQKARKLSKLLVLEKTELTGDEHSFRVTLACPNSEPFQSGDLLAIYPADDGRERLYSIAKVDGHLQLLIKHYPNGLGSDFLYRLQVGDTLMARIVKNNKFHRPRNKKVIMIANGTGIAPFLGMIAQHKGHEQNELYAGFRQSSPLIVQHQEFLNAQKQKGRLSNYQLAWSRAAIKQYVMDLIKKDQQYIADSLKSGAVLMLCGSLAMQNDVEQLLEQICQEHIGLSLTHYKNKEQFLTDCY